jgi:NAD-dependent protein deacetylase/lipoamidase
MKCSPSRQHTRPQSSMCARRRAPHARLEVRARDWIRSADPPCHRCGGILKSATISFGQPLIPEVIADAMRAAEQADLLLAVGTSLQVYPVAGMVPTAKVAGALVVIVNAQETPFDDMADAVFHRTIAEVLPAICEPLGAARSTEGL